MKTLVEDLLQGNRNFNSKGWTYHQDIGEGLSRYVLNWYRISPSSGSVMVREPGRNNQLCALKIQRPEPANNTNKFPMKFQQSFEGGDLQEKTCDSTTTPSIQLKWSVTLSPWAYITLKR